VPDALRTRQMLLADLFVDGDDDALPAGHCAHTRRQGHGNLAERIANSGISDSGAERSFSPHNRVGVALDQLLGGRAPRV